MTDRGEGRGATRGIGGDVSIRELCQTLWGGKWLIAGLCGVAGAIGIIYALLAKPVYRVDVLLAPTDEERAGSGAALLEQYGGLAALAGLQLPSAGSGATEAIALLKSRAFTDEFIDDNELLPILFASQWDDVSKSWRVGANRDAPSLRKAFDLWDTKIRSVQEDKKTGLVTLVIEWTDREQAAQWAQQLVDRLNAATRHQAIDDAERSMSYLNKELERTSIVGVQQAIYRLIEQQVKVVMLANSREEYAFRIIDPPVVPDESQRVSPKRKLIVLLSVLAGGVFGVLVIFVRRAWRQELER